MNRLDWYLGRNILSATLLAWLVVVVLEGAFIFLGQLGDIGRGDYGVLEAGAYSLLTLPARSWHSFPMVVLLGALLGLGSLAVHNELNAFRLAGCSDARLVRSVLLSGLLLTLAAVLLGELLAPPARESAVRLRASAMYDEVQLQGGQGFWVRSGRRFVRVDSTTVDGRLIDLEVWDPAGEARLRSVTAIGQAWFADGVWQLRDVRESFFGEDRVSARQRERDRAAQLMDPGLAMLLRREPQGLTLPELSRYIEYLQGNGADASLYRLSWWKRLASPVAVLAMLLLGLGVVLGPFGRHGGGQRVLAGVFIGLVFKLLNDISAHAGLVYGLPPVVSAFLPSMLVLVPALFLLYRTGSAAR